MKTTVVNVRDEKCDVHICRPSKWGNPFYIGADGTRAQVIARYRAYITTRPDMMKQLHELKGKRLGCYCKPLPCHGDVLTELADNELDK